MARAIWTARCSSATHAWIEALMPHLGWVGFDPTNWLVAGDRHIRTAIGRDYADVPPTHGIFRGRAASELTVAVRVTPSRGYAFAGSGAAGAGGLVDPGGEGDAVAGAASAAYAAAADGAAAAVGYCSSELSPGVDQRFSFLKMRSGMLRMTNMMGCHWNGT